MRIPLLSTVLFSAAFVCASDPVSDASAEVKSSAISKPTFIPTTLKAPFLEQFTDNWESRWKVSHAKKKDDKSADEEWEYVGTWSVEEPSVLKGMEGDKGLVVKDKAAHHGISAKFPSVIDNTGKTLVVQYEVKLQNSLECGGAYIKILQENDALHTQEFSNESPYVIMFGPDKCGATNKVHFIFRHKNPVTGEYEEKHLKKTGMARITKVSALYTLIVNPDQTFQININGEQISSGSLLEDFSPSVNPPKEIDDKDDKKPEDWVNDARIPDPNATKPEDWDEDAPFEIIDDKATKPSDWLDDEPLMIVDPEAQKPEDWDDEEDGDWVPLTVQNPRCDEVSGCGPWTQPMMKNPNYKGKWKAPKIDNPEYKGVWKPRKIPNPNYFEDNTPANFEPMGAIGIEIWTMQNNILFDNIYVGHSVEDAEAFKKETWDVKFPYEKQDDVKESQAESPLDLKFMQDPVHYVREKISLFWEIALRDPVYAVKFVPEVAGGIAVVVIIVLLLLVSAIRRPSTSRSTDKIQNATKDVKDDSADEKEKQDIAPEGISTGTEEVQASATKRTTKSSSGKERKRQG